MSHLTNIVRKELKELLTPGTVASIMVMMVLFMALGGLIGGEVEKAKVLPPVAIVDSDNGKVTLSGGETWDLDTALRAVYAGSIPPGRSVDDYVYEVRSVKTPDGKIDYADLAGRLGSLGLSSALIVPERFSTLIGTENQASLEQFYIYEAEGLFDSSPSVVVSSLISSLNGMLSRTLLTEEAGITNYWFYTNPIRADGIGTMINGNYVSDISPAELASQVTSQTMMVPLVIMIIIMMVGSIVISSMGSEKENKTLETLLTLPIRRTVIVTGKIIAAAVVGLVYGLAYMIGMSFYMNAMTSEIASGISLEDVGLGLELQDYLLLMLSIFLSIVCALGICMIMGAFAKNYKSAQTMTMPLSILAMIPAFVIMFSGWYGTSSAIQGVLFAIPFSHPMIAMQALMYNDYSIVLYGIAYMAVFSAIMILITVRLYNSDILITGLGQSKAAQRFSRKR